MDTEEMNPVIRVVEDVAERQGQFTSEELGLTDDELKDALNAVMDSLMNESVAMHGMPAIQQEDLYYLFLLGLVSGYELHKVQNQTQGETSATD